MSQNKRGAGLFGEGSLEMNEEHIRRVGKRGKIGEGIEIRAEDR